MATKKTLYMETTEIPATRTAGEIASKLMSAGAVEISQRFENGKIVGLRWTMRIAGREALFSMPARVEPVYGILHARRERWGANKFEARDREQAERVAWRQLLRWIEAQLAMIDCGMVEAVEVFLPYMEIGATGQTVFNAFQESQFKALPAPGGGMKQ